MKIVMFGATGMIGRGALLECLDATDVEEVLAVTRRPTGHSHPRFRELIHENFTDYSAIEGELAGYDACLFCLGVSSGGMSEARYREITVDYAVAAGEALLRLNPGMRMCFVSGAGTDVDGRQMWARVKGEAEQRLLAMPWRSAHMFRPAMIQPLRGVVSQVTSYRVLYKALGWTFPLWQRVAPKFATTSVVLGQALLRAARDGHPKSILEGDDINLAGA